jgi:hypothetical protein
MGHGPPMKTGRILFDGYLMERPLLARGERRGKTWTVHYQQLTKTSVPISLLTVN